MRYALMVYEGEGEPVEAAGERTPTCAVCVEAMRRAGVYVAGDRLRGVATATTLRISGNRTRLVDGPYAETPEQLGAFHVIDVPDLDAALAWAAHCPSASRGAVEVRPVLPT